MNRIADPRSVRETATPDAPDTHPSWCSPLFCRAAGGGPHASQPARLPVAWLGEQETLTVSVTQHPDQQPRIDLALWCDDHLEPDARIAVPADLGPHVVRMVSAAMWAAAGCEFGEQR